jgi:hypothetical protein
MNDPMELTTTTTTGRITVQTVTRLHQLFGGNATNEQTVLVFIQAKYGAANLSQLPAAVAKAAIARPDDFLRAAKAFCEPEMSF